MPFSASRSQNSVRQMNTDDLQARKERKREYDRKRHAANPEPARERARLYYQNHMTPSRRRFQHLRGRYGVDEKSYFAMLADQRDRCAACGCVFEGVPYVDHSHATGEVRGLLCPGCNTVCGSLENPRRSACEEYLKKYPASRPESV